MSTWGWKDGDDRALEFPDETSPHVAPAKGPGNEGRGRIIYSDAAKAFKASMSGSPYVPLGVGSPGAAAQPAWFIDPVNGNDNRAGNSAAAALKTHEELRRRIGTQPINQVTTVEISGDMGVDNPVIIDFQLGGFSSGLIYRGTKALTTLASGTITAVTAIAPATNQPAEVEDAGLAGDWGPLGLVNGPSSFGTGGDARRIRITGGANAGAMAWAVFDLAGGGGTLGAKAARVSPFGFPLTTLSGPDPLSRQLAGGVPAVTDPYVVEAGFVKIDALIIDLKGPPLLSGFGFSFQLLFNDIELDPDFVIRPLIRSNGERGFPPLVIMSGCAAGRLTLNGDGIVSIEYSRMGGFFANQYAGRFEIAAAAMLCGFNVRKAAECNFFANTIFQGGVAAGQGGLVIDGRVSVSSGCWMDVLATDAITVQPGGILRHISEPPDPGVIYGTGSDGNGVAIQAGGQLVYEALAANAAASGITVDGTGGEADVAGTASTWVLIAPDLAVASKLAAVSAQ